MSDSKPPPVKTCDNCKRDISEANFLIHTVHCHRNIVLCKKCDAPFSKDEIEQHIRESHSKISCTRCGLQVEQHALEDHNASECSNRMVICRFCEIEVPAVDRDDHEDYCGSRTERCDVCGQYVMVKFVDIHLSSNHSFLSLADAEKPQKLKLNNAVDEKSQNRAPFRISPGKRTNDMPQVNVDRAAEKNLNSKAVLQAATLLPTKFSVEESDRLLALQIAREDAEQSNDVLAAGYGDDFIPDRHCDLLRGFPDPVPEIAASSRIVGTPLNRLFPEVTSAGREEIESSKLPCEFCGELLPGDALLHHQAACEAGDEEVEHADLGMLLNKERQASSHFVEPIVHPLFDRRARNAIDAFLAEPTVAATNSDRNFLIPCEYCNELFDASLVTEHQDLCKNEAPIVNRSVLPLKYERPLPLAGRQAIERRSVPPRDPDDDDDLEEQMLRDAIADSLRDGHAVDRRNQYVPIVRDVPIERRPNLSQRAQLEESEKENALRELRRLKEQLSNSDGPLVTSRHFGEPDVTQRNNTPGARPNSDAATGRNARGSLDRGFLLQDGTFPAQNAFGGNRGSREPNRLSSLNKRHI